MAIRYSDPEIAHMIQERKPLPTDYRARTQLRTKRGHKERELDVEGAEGGKFRIILRQSDYNTLDFSVILAVELPESNQIFRLRRYNGKSHEHTNRIEGDTFYGFHIHQATERYQELGGREDAYAEPTDEYADFQSALQCLLKGCGFEPPGGFQTTFLAGVEL